MLTYLHLNQLKMILNAKTKTESMVPKTIISIKIPFF